MKFSLSVRHFGPVVALLCAVLAFASSAQDLDAFFEVETLNPGLGVAPDDLYRDTPQSTVESFLDAAAADDFERAAHLLDVSDIAEADQSARGADLARQLHSVLDRRVVISWSQLLERSDAMNAAASSNSAVAGQGRRSLLLAVLDVDDREAAIRLDRIKPAGGPAVWVFSKQTVRKVPALYNRYGPSELEASLPRFLKQDTVIGLALWEVIGLPIVIFLAAMSGRLVYRLFSALSRRNESRWMSIVLASLRWPSVICAVTTVVWLSTQYFFVVSGKIAAIVHPLVVIGYVSAAVIFAISVIDTILERIVDFGPEELSGTDKSRTRTIATTLSAGRRIFILLAICIAIGLVFTSANLFRTFGFSLLASAGAITIVLGFAARRVLGNIMASLQIALNRTARIGDLVIYNDEWCIVERINFTHVQLKVWNGTRLIVPVEHFVSESFENWSIVDPEMVDHFVLTLAHSADIDALRKVFHDLVADEDDIIDKDEAKAAVVEQDMFGPKVRFQFPVPDGSTGWDIECRLREALIAAAQRLERETGRAFLPQPGRIEDGDGVPG